MARNFHKRRAPDAQSQFSDLTPEENADLAFKSHTAVMKALRADPALADNPWFVQMRTESFHRFLDAWNKVV